MLTVTQLEDRTPAVSLVFDWTFSPYQPGSYIAEAVKRAAESVAVRLTPMNNSPNGLPAGNSGYTALTPWGVLPNRPPAAADTLTVYVGTATAGTLGEGGPVSWSASGTGLNRSPGFTLALDPNPSTWASYSLTNLVQHEVLHGAAQVDTHALDPKAIMYPYQSPGVHKSFTPVDVSLVRQHGYEFWTMPGDSVVKCKDGVWGSGGFAMLSLREAGILYSQGMFSEYEMLPAGTPVLK